MTSYVAPGSVARSSGGRRTYRFLGIELVIGARRRVVCESQAELTIAVSDSIGDGRGVSVFLRPFLRTNYSGKMLRICQLAHA